VGGNLGICTNLSPGEVSGRKFEYIPLFPGENYNMGKKLGCNTGTSINGGVLLAQTFPLSKLLKKDTLYMIIL
jgi:hypothetical protein